jgi:hypothetical protein
MACEHECGGRWICRGCGISLEPTFLAEARAQGAAEERARIVRLLRSAGWWIYANAWADAIERGEAGDK